MLVKEMIIKMPIEMMIAFKIIFGLFVIMAIRIAWLMKKDKKEKGHIHRKQVGGKLRW